MKEITQKTFEFRRAQDKEFRRHIWMLERLWQDARFKDVKEIARSLMHLAEESGIHWESTEGITHETRN